MEKTDLTTILKDALVERNNPTDLKTIIIGVVRQVSPVIVGINENKILLEENDELLISEWFRFRCNIDKTSKLSSGVVGDLSDSDSNCDSAKGVSETHSYTGAPCNMPSAISYLASAISKTKTKRPTAAPTIICVFLFSKSMVITPFYTRMWIIYKLKKICKQTLSICYIIFGEVKFVYEERNCRNS